MANLYFEKIAITLTILLKEVEENFEQDHNLHNQKDQKNHGRFYILNKSFLELEKKKNNIKGNNLMNQLYDILISDSAYT